MNYPLIRSPIDAVADIFDGGIGCGDEYDVGHFGNLGRVFDDLNTRKQGFKPRAVAGAA